LAEVKVRAVEEEVEGLIKDLAMPSNAPSKPSGTHILNSKFSFNSQFRTSLVVS